MEIVEKLEQGDISILENDFISIKEIQNSIEQIRRSERKKEIINGFLNQLKNLNPEFCMNVVYDMDAYQEVVFSILQKSKDPLAYFSKDKLENILNRTSWGVSFIYENLEEILIRNLDFYKPLLHFVFSHKETEKRFIDSLFMHSNLSIRAGFMLYVAENHFAEISNFYDEITNYFTCFHQGKLEYMPSKYVSRLAILLLKQGSRKNYYQIKEFILKNYKENDLARFFLEESNLNLENEFLTDCDRLFTTSANYQFEIFEDYSNRLSKEVQESFTKFLSYFKNEKLYLANFEYYDIELILKNGLGRELREYIDKYLSLSKRTDSEFIRSGTTTSCYRIGDYAFKLCKSKWSCEEIICPDLYIIIKNLEEHYLRLRNGEVVAGLEVQPFLTRSIKEYPKDVQKKICLFLRQELERLGWYNLDSLIGSSCGDNAMLLDSYLDADAPSLERVPPFFKQYPAVYIDRDRFYRIENHYPHER